MPYRIITPLVDLMRKQLKRAAVYSRLGIEETLDSMVSFATICGARMKNDLPLNGSGFRIPTGSKDNFNSRKENKALKEGHSVV